MPGPFLLFALWYALCPARIFEDAASDADEVRRTVAEQVVCGFHIRDAAGEHDGNGHGLLDRPAEVFKICALSHQLGHKKLAQSGRDAVDLVRRHRSRRLRALRHGNVRCAHRLHTDILCAGRASGSTTCWAMTPSAT